MLITPNLWNFQRVLHTLAAPQEVPRHTRLHSRGSTSVPPSSRGPHLRLLARGKGPFPCVFGKKFSVFPSQLKRIYIHTHKEHNHSIALQKVTRSQRKRRRDEERNKRITKENSNCMSISNNNYCKCKWTKLREATLILQFNSVAQSCPTLYSQIYGD